MKRDVFQYNLKDGAEKEDQDLHEEIKEIIEGGDLQDIYDSFNGLKNTAVGYLKYVETVCPDCTQ